MKIPRDTKEKIETYQKSLKQFITLLKWSGSFYRRRQIKMTDLEFQEYEAVMAAEVLLLPIDAFLFDAWLLWVNQKVIEHQERRTWIEKLFAGRRRIPDLVTSWVAFREAAKKTMYTDKQGDPHIAEEVVTDA